MQCLSFFCVTDVSDQELAYAFWKLVERWGSNNCCRAVFRIYFTSIQKLSIGGIENMDKEKGDKNFRQSSAPGSYDV